MSGKRILTLARRVIRQLANDRRTLALVIFAPMLMLSLGAILFRAEVAAVPIGLVNKDQGMAAPGGVEVNLGQRIADVLAENESVSLVSLAAADSEAALINGTVLGVITLSPDFTSEIVRDPSHQMAIDVRLEGSDPARNRQIMVHVSQAAIGAIAGLGLGGLATAEPMAEPPVALNTTYLYAGEMLDTLDYIAPAYIAFLAFFFVFLLTCVAFLRERSQGTMERLLATPATRLEIILGYMGGLGLFAVIQVLIIVTFTIWVLRVHFLGSVALMLVIVGFLALVGVSMGILASTFARNEFQVIQFIPIVIIPQALLSGMVWPIRDMPSYLQPLAYIMPLTYANRALRDVMLKGRSLADIRVDLLILTLFIVVTIALGALTVRREVV